MFDALVPAFATLGLTKDEAIAVKLDSLDFQRRYDVVASGTWAVTVQLSCACGRDILNRSPL